MTSGDPAETDASAGFEGREVRVQLKSMESGISVLSAPTAAVGIGSEHASVVSVGSDSNLDLLEETERLLAKMNHLNSTKWKVNDGASPERPDFQSNAEMEDSNELNKMLEKAGHLSSMMQSISETISLNGGGSASFVYSATSKRDPDGSSISDLQKAAVASLKAAANLTPATMHDVSSYARHSFLRQDPPGSVATHEKPEGNGQEQVLQNNSPVSGFFKRPTMAVHLPTTLMDDDVSSVGSSSFRPYHRVETNPRKLLSHKDATPDNLLGTLPPKLAWTQHTASPVDSIPETEQLPVCFKIPPTDLRANFDDSNFVESSTRRDATEGGVQWEKVTTANPGEDDYVPIIDYSQVRHSWTYEGVNNINNITSRLELHRQRTQARRKRKMKLVTAILSLMSIAAVYGYYRYKLSITKVTSHAESPFYSQCYDTTLLLDKVIYGFSFEGEDASLVVTLPPSIPPPENSTKKRKQRGLFGRR